jgi:hypothetical protein
MSAEDVNVAFLNLGGEARDPSAPVIGVGDNR